jgi:Zn-dependent M32 family carboxypeptidase
MVKMSYDVVKRWVNEAQEAASSDNIMVQVGYTHSVDNMFIRHQAEEITYVLLLSSLI